LIDLINIVNKICS